LEVAPLQISDTVVSAASVLSGGKIIAAIKEAGVRYVAALPDKTTSHGLLFPISADPDLRVIRLSKEDEGVAICVGLAFCQKRALLMIQNTGMFYSVNALRGMAVEYQQPVCMVVGLLAKEPGVLPQESRRYGVRIVEPILDAMGITHYLIENDDDVAKIRPAIDDAYAKSRPVALLIGRRPVAP
jgi:sulfopyruvate decarboxylase subunit alpha